VSSPEDERLGWGVSEEVSSSLMAQKSSRYMLMRLACCSGGERPFANRLRGVKKPSAGRESSSIVCSRESSVVASRMFCRALRRVCDCVDVGSV